jgi:hypothetical protein
MSLECGDAQAYEPNEGSVVPKFRSPRPVSVRSEVSLGPIHQCITPFPRQRFGEEFHHPRVGIHASKRFPVGIAPAAENQAASGQDWILAHDIDNDIAAAICAFQSTTGCLQRPLVVAQQFNINNVKWSAPNVLDPVNVKFWSALHVSAVTRKKS